MDKKRISAVIASMALAASMMTVFPASADYKYSPVAGENTQFDKYLVMDEDANVPVVSFEYTIAAGEAQSFSESGRTMAVYPGPTPEKIAITGTGITDSDTADSKFEIGFSAEDTAKTTAASDELVKGLDTGEKFAKKTAKLDLSAVQFTEPGIYRYIITETKGTAAGITYDEDLTRVLDVYVEDVTDEDGEPGLAVTAYILHATDAPVSLSGDYGSDGNVIQQSADPETEGEEGEETPAETPDDDKKSQGFTNEYTSHDLVFSKTVSGNQASKDKYFAFTLNIEGAVPGTVFDVSYADDSNDNTVDGDADVNIAASPNNATTVITEAVEQPAKLTAGEDGKVTQVFYLQHGQKIAVRGLAEGTKYSIDENEEDYAPSYVTDDTDDTTAAKKDVASNSTGIKKDVKIDFTNTRSGNIPTGLLLSIAAPAVIGLITLAGIIFLAYRNRRRESEED